MNIWKQDHEESGIKWDDVAVNEGVLRKLLDKGFSRMTSPDLLGGAQRLTPTVLLQGDAGTGKSYLANVLASKLDTATTFISVNKYTAKLASEWMAERITPTLFEIAFEKRPAVIFVDDIDIVCSGPASDQKYQLLSLMDQVNENPRGDVMVLAATSNPKRLNSALRRKFRSKVHVTLPDVNARTKMFRQVAESIPCGLREEDYRTLAIEAEGLSNSDIKLAVQAAVMEIDPNSKLIHDGVNMITVRFPGISQMIEMPWTDAIVRKGLLERSRPLLLEDIALFVRQYDPGATYYYEREPTFSREGLVDL